MGKYDEIRVEMLTPGQARRIRLVAAAVYEDAHASEIAAGKHNDSMGVAAGFGLALDVPGVRVAYASLRFVPLGLAFGYPLTDPPWWWENLRLDAGQPSLDEFTREDGERTFLVRELMVDEQFSGQGVASALLRALVDAQPQARATWLVKPSNIRAVEISRHWGARKVGARHIPVPELNSEVVDDVYVVDLPLPARFG